VAAQAERRPAPPVVVLGVPDRYLPQGNAASILSELGLDGVGLAASVLAALGDTGPDVGAATEPLRIRSVGS
jgi:deoxyxylulose-5-phosphate synthase